MNTTSRYSRHTKRIITLVSLISTLVVVASGNMTAQAKGTISSDDSLYSELSKAPAKAAARQNPLEKDPDAVLGGAKLFAQHCAECHGESAEGGKGKKAGPSLRAEEVQGASSGTLFWLLSNGVVRRGMPVWSKLPEPQRWQLVSFIKSLGQPSRPKAEGPATP